MKIGTNKASRFTVQGSYSSFTHITMTFEVLHLFSSEPTIIIIMMIIISHENGILKDFRNYSYSFRWFNLNHDSKA